RRGNPRKTQLEIDSYISAAPVEHHHPITEDRELRRVPGARSIWRASAKGYFRSIARIKQECAARSRFEAPELQRFPSGRAEHNHPFAGNLGRKWLPIILRRPSRFHKIGARFQLPPRITAH